MASYTKRWISSSTITLCLLLIVIFLPVWNFSSQKDNQIMSNQESEISMVTIQKTVKKKVLEEKKLYEPVKKLENTIPVLEETVKEEVEPVVEEEEMTAEDELENPEADENTAENQTAANNIISQNTASEKTVESYKSYALNRIASRKSYPVSARTKGQEGKVKIHLIIDNEGNIRTLEILVPSEYEILNEAALNAVKKSAPFKKMKDGLNVMELKFTMDFSLSE